MLKELPFLRIGLPICIGIITGLYFNPGISFLVIFSLCILAGFIFSMFFNKRIINNLFGIPLSCALYMCGLLLYTNEKESLSELSSEKEVYMCSLSEYPEEKENSYKLIAKLYSTCSIKGNVPLKGSLLLYCSKDQRVTNLLPGDFLKIKCSAVPITNKGNPFEFNYRFFMENQGVKYYGFAGPDDFISQAVPEHRKLRHKALIIREKIIGMYKNRGITGDRLALVAAITLGQKNMLDPDQKQVFIKAGVMHIMAVSGLHTVILSLFLYNLLFFLKGKLDFLRTIITVLFLWAFAFVTGLTPSVLRATLMFSFLQAGKMMHRNVNSINSVLASAVILIIIHPSVIFDAGFLLSYSAVIFIVSFYRGIYLKVKTRTWIGDKICQSAAVTIIAQLGTLPLTISLFNRFPTWFILTNIVIVPLSSLLVIIGCIIPLTYPIVFISRPLALVLDYLTGLTETLTSKASSLPFSSIENIGLGTFESLLLFIAISLLIVHFINRKSVQLKYPLIALLLFVLTGTVRDIKNKTTGELIVYYSTSTGAIGIRTGKTINLYTDSLRVPPEVQRHRVAGRLKIKSHIQGKEPILIEAGKVKILLTSYFSDEVFNKTEPDIVILNGTFIRKGEKARPGKPAKFILPSARKISDKLKIAIKERGTEEISSVYKSGAIRIGL